MTTDLVSCYITAGGKATRMNGRIKAFIEIEGERIIDKNLREINSIFSEIGIITNSPDKFLTYKDSGFKIKSDKYKNIGPLAGIHSAIYYSSMDYVFVVASDMPNISKSLIIELIAVVRNKNIDAVIPIHDSKIEPLFAIYSKSLLPKLESFIEEGSSFAIRDFIKIINVEYNNVPNIIANNIFTNINYQSDISTK